MSKWIESGLQYGSEYHENSFVTVIGETNLVGLLIETEYGQHLIGHINEVLGTCDCCKKFYYTTIVIRYKRIWSPH